MNKVICIGEALVDLLPDDNGLFVPMAGGAPANVCACVAKLGGHGVFLGKLSYDEYGRLLIDSLKSVGVDMHAAVYADFKTAYSTVTLKDGDRSFSFFRENTADLNLCEDEVPEALFQENDILHFCSVSLVESPTKYAHIRAIQLAHLVGTTVSFDVNLRPSLWDSNENLLNTVLEFLPFADIVKVSDDELDFIAKGNIQHLFEIARRAKIIIVTKGAAGACVYDRSGAKFIVPAYCKKPIDTTGAGDCFIGSILYKLAVGDAKLTLDGIHDAVVFASKACAISVSRKGAISSYPARCEIE